MNLKRHCKQTSFSIRRPLLVNWRIANDYVEKCKSLFKKNNTLLLVNNFILVRIGIQKYKNMT